MGGCLFVRVCVYRKSKKDSLKLVHLLLRVAQLLQYARQLPLVRGARLGPADGLVQARRPAHKHLDVGLLGFRQNRLEQLLGNVAFTLHPALGRVVEDVEGAEAVRVGVFEVLELGLEEDVGFAEVAEDEGDFGFVRGVLEDGADELVHSVFLTLLSVGCLLLLLVLGGGVRARRKQQK